jgi:hypothetical protein
MTYGKWISAWHSYRCSNERFGQAFCNDFIRESWPELYYEEDVDVADALIQEWLLRHHYNADMVPEKIS